MNIRKSGSTYADRVAKARYAQINKGLSGNGHGPGNPYHDKRGEFTDASGNVSGTNSSGPKAETGAHATTDPKLEAKNAAHRAKVEKAMKRGTVTEHPGPIRAVYNTAAHVKWVANDVRATQKQVARNFGTKLPPKPVGASRGVRAKGR